MDIVLSIAAIILLVFLAIKLTGKLIKIVIAVVFVGFIVYLVTGTNVFPHILELLGLQ